MSSYLEDYAEAEIKLLEKLDKVYCQCLTIPVYDEPNFDFRAFLVSNIPTLFLINVNSNENSSDQSIAQNNKTILEINANTQLIWQNQYVSYHKYENHGVILVCQTLSSKQGVGLARKILCDIACYYWSKNCIKDNWLYCTDADVRLPMDYFEQIDEKGSAAVFQFKHQAQAGLEKAMQVYEDSLHYYVNALRWAGSPYAYHTIGSCLVIDFQSYVAVRGFPKRSGGEDFYCLNKLAKVGKVISLKGRPIIIDGRLSTRVPFGTGPALQKVLDNNFRSYHARSFVLLKRWLTALHENKIESLPEIFKFYVQEKNVLEPIQKIRENHGADSINKALNDWFDAFKTLKFINYYCACLPRVSSTNQKNTKPISK